MSTFNVAKFGGTSVANFEAMSRCSAIIENNPQTRLVVSSACSGVTNLLVELANAWPQLNAAKPFCNSWPISIM